LVQLLLHAAMAVSGHVILGADRDCRTVIDRLVFLLRFLDERLAHQTTFSISINCQCRMARSKRTAWIKCRLVSPHGNAIPQSPCPDFVRASTKRPSSRFGGSERRGWPGQARPRRV